MRHEELNTRLVSSKLSSFAAIGCGALLCFSGLTLASREFLWSPIVLSSLGTLILFYFSFALRSSSTLTLAHGGLSLTRSHGVIFSLQWKEIQNVIVCGSMFRRYVQLTVAQDNPRYGGDTHPILWENYGLGSVGLRDLILRWQETNHR